MASADSHAYLEESEIGMGVYRNWVSFARTKFSKSQTHGRVIVNNINNSKSLGEDDENECEELIAVTEDVSGSSSSVKKEYSAEEIAAIKIQAFYRGSLARQAFRALRSIVKLQALVRGVRVRRQSRMALHFMHALVRLQVSVRTRQLLRKANDN